MPAATICTVSGTCLKPDGTADSGVTVMAYMGRPFVHTTDSALYMDYLVTTTTASDGTWSLSLVETTTNALTMTIAFSYSGSTSDTKRKEYSVSIPNSASATFASLITGQV